MSTIQYIKDLAAKKVPSKTIASVLNLDIDYVIEVRRSMHYNVTTPIHKLNEQQLQQLHNLFIEGKSSRYIARTLNLNYDALTSYLDEKYPNQRKTRNVIDQATKDIICRMYQAGDSVKRIAELTNRPSYTISKLLKDKGIYRYENTKLKNRLTKKQVEALYSLHKQGVSADEIAKQLNVNRSTVVRRLQKKKAL